MCIGLGAWRSGVQSRTKPENCSKFSHKINEELEDLCQIFIDFSTNCTIFQKAFRIFRENLARIYYIFLIYEKTINY